MQKWVLSIVVRLTDARIEEYSMYYHEACLRKRSQ